MSSKGKIWIVGVETCFLWIKKSITFAKGAWLSF